MTELDRHKGALQVAIGALRELGLDYSHFTDRVEKRIAAILEPPQEMEDVELVRWLDPDTGDTRNAEFHAIPAHYVKLTGTIKRPVKRPVVKEVSVDAILHPVDGSTTAFRNHPECHGKTGTLIFRYTE